MSTTIHRLSARSCFWSSQIINIGTMVAIIIPVLIFIWFFGSMVSYAMVAHHPDSRVGHYTRIAGYRFYGYVGSLPVVLIFASKFHEWSGGPLHTWLWVWGVGLVVLLPWGLWDLYRASREQWQDMEVEVPVHD